MDRYVRGNTDGWSQVSGGLCNKCGYWYSYGTGHVCPTDWLAANPLYHICNFCGGWWKQGESHFCSCAPQQTVALLEEIRDLLKKLVEQKDSKWNGEDFLKHSQAYSELLHQDKR